jgi:hypothetical protein
VSFDLPTGRWCCHTPVFKQRFTDHITIGQDLSRTGMAFAGRNQEIPERQQSILGKAFAIVMALSQIKEPQRVAQRGGFVKTSPVWTFLTLFFNLGRFSNPRCEN